MQQPPGGQFLSTKRETGSSWRVWSVSRGSRGEPGKPDPLRRRPDSARRPAPCSAPVPSAPFLRLISVLWWIRGIPVLKINRRTLINRGNFRIAEEWGACRLAERLAGRTGRARDQRAVTIYGTRLRDTACGTRPAGHGL